MSPKVPWKEAMLLLPYSISGYTTHQKQDCCHNFVNCERQQKPTVAEESAKESRHLTCGMRLPPSSEILFSAVCFPTWSWRSVRTWHRMQKENCPLLELLLDSHAHPRGCKGTPLAEIDMPDSLVLAKSAGGLAFGTHSPPPRHKSYMIFEKWTRGKKTMSWLNRTR